ncbi:MAG: hypothetical protein P4L79_13960 [Legionella sp.]|uniref:hypothetical protein n=1 Tax=Legionella sp. TaxID=459 RepID=UPI00284C0B39|nr:hypothetical protein [Legionella sp.]
MAKSKIDLLSLPPEVILAIADQLRNEDFNKLTQELQPISDQLAFFSTSKNSHNFLSTNPHNIKRMLNTVEECINSLAVKTIKKEHMLNEHLQVMAEKLERLKAQRTSLITTFFSAMFLAWLSFILLLLANDYVDTDLSTQLVIATYIAITLLSTLILADSLNHELSQRTLRFFEKRSVQYERERVEKLSQCLPEKRLSLETQLAAQLTAEIEAKCSPDIKRHPERSEGSPMQAPSQML